MEADDEAVFTSQEVMPIYLLLSFLLLSASTISPINTQYAVLNTILYPFFSNFEIMQNVSQITEFGKVFLYLVMGVLFVLFSFFMASLVALKKPNSEKLTSYECGEEPTGNSWIQFNSRFYVVALVFLLFDVEMVFIFPWTTIFSHQALLAADPRWGWLTLIEMFLFVGILIIGLVYVWKKGDLEWFKPTRLVPTVSTKVPDFLYQRINQEKYTVKPFNLENTLPNPEMPQKISSVPSRPQFKPTFKKSAE